MHTDIKDFRRRPQCGVLCRHLPENTQGRDFVVGDLHGCYLELRALLEMVGFIPETDRLFCTGDLLHRGPFGRDCLSLLRQPWFYSVLGNHDTHQMTADEAEMGLRLAFDAELSELPMMIHVEGERDFHVLHAELPYQLIFSKESLAGESRNKHEDIILSGGAPGRVYEVLQKIPSDMLISDLSDTDRYSLLWGRELWSATKKSVSLENPAHYLAYPLRIFCGHSPVARVTRIGYQFFCDTGACFAYTGKKKMPNRFGLSMVEVATGQVSFIESVTFRQSRYRL